MKGRKLLTLTASVFLIFAVVSLSLAVACAKPAPKPAPPPAPTPAPTPPAPAPPPPAPLPKTILIGGGPIGSLAYAWGVGIAAVITAHTPMKVEVFAQGRTVWYPMLGTGEAQIGMGLNDEDRAGYLGEYVYKEITKGKGYDLRILMVGLPFSVGFVVPGDSDIKTIPDLKGKRVPTDYGAFFSSTLTAEALLANGGLTTADVKGMKVTDVVAGVRAVIEGRADVAVSSVGMATVEELKAAKGARFLPLDPSPEAVKRMKAAFPGYFLNTEKPGPAGIDKEMVLMGKSMTLACGDNLRDDVAYEITKILWVDYKELERYQPQLRLWTPDRYASTLATIPYHPAAIKFYKEKGVWTAEMEAHQKKLLAAKPK